MRLLRQITVYTLVVSASVFLSPQTHLAAQETGAVMAQLANLTPEQLAGVLRYVKADLVDANGKVVATQTPTNGTFNFARVPPGNYKVGLRLDFEMKLNTGGGVVDVPSTDAIGSAGSANVTVAAGQTANIAVAVTPAAAAAAVSAAAAAGGTGATAGSFGLLGMGTTGTILAGAAAVGLIAGIALTRDGDSSPSR